MNYIKYTRKKVFNTYENQQIQARLFYLLEIINISRSFENVLESPIKVVDIIGTKLEMIS